MKIFSKVELTKNNKIILLILLLSSCGGSSETPLAPQNSSNDWNSLTWGQDNWG